VTKVSLKYYIYSREERKEIMCLCPGAGIFLFKLDSNMIFLDK